jgi:type VI protein secretion system component VasK
MLSVLIAEATDLIFRERWMTVRKDWMERIALFVCGWVLGIFMGVWIAKWLF